LNLLLNFKAVSRDYHLLSLAAVFAVVFAGLFAALLAALLAALFAALFIALFAVLEEIVAPGSLLSRCGPILCLARFR
jgi:hypothetical protein